MPKMHTFVLCYRYLDNCHALVSRSVSSMIFLGGDCQLASATLSVTLKVAPHASFTGSSLCQSRSYQSSYTFTFSRGGQAKHGEV